ncbi:MAG: TcpE family conjugal transfer membrane protein [Baekduia sp.]
MDIQSFRLVFDLERRLHRIDRWRLPFPNGIPITGIAHAAAVLIAVIALRQLPMIGQLLAAMPAPVTYVLLPAGIAAALTRLKIDGRPAHRHLTAQALAPLTTTRTAAGRRTPPGPIYIDDTPLLAASPTAPEYPGCTITGPAIVRLTRPARAQPRGNTLHITPVQGTPLARGKTIRLRPGQRLKVAAR